MATKKLHFETLLVHSGQNIFGRNEVSVPTGNYVVKVTGENGKNFSLKITVS